MKRIQSMTLMLLIALGMTLFILFCVGESPSTLLKALQYTFLNPFGLGYSLYYTTPLLFTGLAVALCFQAGLFNIGAEGQLYWGAISIIFLSQTFPHLSSWLAIPLGVAVAGIAGGIWAFLPGYLKANKGINEVITTLLLNFISVALVNYLILYPLKNPDSQAAETLVLPAPYRLTHDYFATTPLNATLLLGIASALLCYIFLYKTVPGYELRAMGQSSRAARFAGIDLKKRTIQIFICSGFLSGLVGVNEVMGGEYKVIEGFSPGYGFTGIAVALLARNHPLAIIGTSFVLGALQNFSRELEFFGEIISKEVSMVLQALLIILVGTRQWWEKKWN